MSSKPAWKKNVELLEERKKILESEISDLKGKTSRVLKTYYLKQIAQKEAEKNLIVSQIAYLNTKKRDKPIKNVKKGVISGKVLSYYNWRDERLDSKIQKAEEKKARYDELSKGIKTNVGDFKKKSKDAKEDIAKLKKKQARVQGRQRTIMWPKYQKRHQVEFKKAEVNAIHDFRQNRINDFAKTARKLNDGTLGGSIESFRYTVRGQLYKKRVEIAQFFEEKLRNTIATFKGARSTIIPRKKFTSSFGTP